MTFDKINRRTHLYLGIALTPWFLLYAVSSVVLNHGAIVRATRKGPAPQWTRLAEKPYHLPPITDDSDPWDLGEKLLIEQGMLGRYRAHFDDDDNLVVLRQRFSSTIRLTYFPKESRLLVEQKPLRWNESLTQAHFRAGFNYPYFVEILWAITIDLLIVSTLVWIASGLYLWIRLRRFRYWGALALAAGMASFLVVVLRL
jgi:hypothetical protein